MELKKLGSALGYYDDGMYYYFGDNTPKHISVQMQTANASIESCDLRLTTIDNDAASFSKVNWTDVAFFRFGYYSYQKMNLIDMVNKFTNEQWYQVRTKIN